MIGIVFYILFFYIFILKLIVFLNRFVIFVNLLICLICYLFDFLLLFFFISLALILIGLVIVFIIHLSCRLTIYSDECLWLLTTCFFDLYGANINTPNWIKPRPKSRFPSNIPTTSSQRYILFQSGTVI